MPKHKQESGLLFAIALGAALNAACPNGPAAAQQPPHFRIGGGASADLLVGDASDFLDGGFGGFAGVEYRLDPGDHLRLSVEAGWNPLHNQSDVLLATTARNSAFALLAGPRLVGHLGPLRPSVAPSLGIVGVRWRFEPGRTNGADAGASAALAWGARAGLAVAIGTDSPVEIGVEGRILDIGEVDFARTSVPTGMGDEPGLITHDLGMLSVRIAVSVAI